MISVGAATVFLQDTAQQAAVDSLRGFVPDSPLPGVAEGVFRYFFTGVPQWLQIFGAVVGLGASLAILWTAWKRRADIKAWYAARASGVRVTILAGIALMVLAFSAAGVRTWDYMQHDNSFCVACHVMGDASARFGESEHADLNCHDCHDQSIWASMRQLVMWVAERPAEVGDHTPLANAICENCHVEGESAEAWEQVQLTAGHRVHFESGERSLNELMCVTCHGVEVHRFVPAAMTCGQADCHPDTSVELAGMQEVAAEECATCHQFGQIVPALATTDSARATLIPSREQCETCHSMSDRMSALEFEPDRHNGTCGTCHDPHTQHTAQDAAIECAECHTEPENRPFHIGSNHSAVMSECTVCHVPHGTAVDASDCVGCHVQVIANPAVDAGTRAKLRGALPFDTTAALRRSGVETHQPSEIRLPRAGASDDEDSGGGDGAGPFSIVPFGFGGSIPVAPAAVADTFEHASHEELQCSTCHVGERSHGDLAFAQPRGCQICHHQEPATSDCASCHDETPSVDAVLGVTVQDTIHNERSATMAHETHADLECTGCHVESVTLASRPEVAACNDCHEDHHDEAVPCAGCHGTAAGESSFVDAHGASSASHTACVACHAEATIARLMPDELYCRGCHVDLQDDHEEASDLACTSCHMLETPEEFQRRIRSDRKPGGR
jgi:hypothetical protein